MTKEDIKEALEICTNIHGIYDACNDCPYDIVEKCNATLCADALKLITEQEKEIDRLKANDEETCLKCIESKHATAEEYAELQEEFANYQLASDKEIRAQVKQAKIDMLNELKKYLHTEDFDTPDERWKPESEFCAIIDELVKEIRAQ